MLRAVAWADLLRLCPASGGESILWLIELEVWRVGRFESDARRERFVSLFVLEGELPMMALLDERPEPRMI